MSKWEHKDMSAWEPRRSTCPTCGGKVRKWKRGTPFACPDSWQGDTDE